MNGMKPKHTPGPWRVGDAGNTVFGPKTDRPSPQRICDMSIVDHRGNGALIAAAPDMLEALRGLLTEVDGYGKSTPLAVACGIARAAIAKATGVQS